MHLVHELCDRNQQVLARLDQRRGGAQVELGLNRGRTAMCPVSLESPARELASEIETVLRVTLRGPDGFRLPLFIGRVLNGEQTGDPDQQGLHLRAVDPFTQLERALIRSVVGATWEPVWFTGIDQSEIMWQLIDSAKDHGIVRGSTPASKDRDRTYPPGKEVGPALVEMSEVSEGPDFELEPVLADDGTLCRFNTSWPRQGSDLTDTVKFTFGESPFTASSFTRSRAGEEIANRVVAIGAPEEDISEGEALVEHPGYVAEHPGSIARYGAFERRIQLDDVITESTLRDYAEGDVAAKAFPPLIFDFNPEPEPIADEAGEGVPPVFGRDYWIGDTVTGEIHVDGSTEEVTVRLTDAVVRERESGQLQVSLTCATEPADALGIVGRSIKLLVPLEATV